MRLSLVANLRTPRLALLDQWPTALLATFDRHGVLARLTWRGADGLPYAPAGDLEALSRWLADRGPGTFELRSEAMSDAETGVDHLVVSVWDD